MSIEKLKFLLESNPNIPSHTSDITSNYETLIWYDCPILFMGTNAYDDWMVGLSIDEDDKAQQEYYLHTFVTSEQLKQFLSGKISCLTLMQISRVYLIQKDYKKLAPTQACLLGFNDIPEAYRPLPDSILDGDYRQHGKRLINKIEKLEATYEHQEKLKQANQIGNILIAKGFSSDKINPLYIYWLNEKRFDIRLHFNLDTIKYDEETINKTVELWRRCNELCKSHH